MRSSFRDWVRQAAIAYEQGDFVVAAELFLRAHEARQQPELLFNAAQSFRLASCSFVALETHKQFLNAAPDSPVRSYAEQWVRQLDEQLARTRVDELSAFATLARSCSPAC